MPIVNDDHLAAVTSKPIAVKTTPPLYRGVTVDTRYIPLSNLLTHIEGSSWTVNFYSQVLNDDNQVQGQNPNLNPIYQQYRLVKGFELKVNAPLTTSQDTETNAMALQGAATVYPFLIPNVGDMFLADIGDGREGIFKITSVERKAIFKDTCHAIEYIWIDYSTPERRGDLNAKVIQTVQFVRDFLQYGQNPLLQEEDYQIAVKLAERYREMTPAYFKAFASREYKTLVAPAQQSPSYDPFLVGALKRHFSTWDAPEIRDMRTLNTDEDMAFKSLTIWDILSERKPRLVKSAARRMGLVYARNFTKDPMLEGIYWSGIKYVVYPKDPTLTVNLEAMDPLKVVVDDTLTDSPSRITRVEDLLTLLAQDNWQINALPYGDAPLIHAVKKDDHYVFSQAFYERATTGQSKLELAVWDYLEGKAPDNKLLLAFCDTFHAWGGLERFYYMPIVLLLIKASIRSL